MRRRVDEVLVARRVMAGLSTDRNSSVRGTEERSPQSEASTRPEPRSRVVRTGEVLQLLGVSRVTLWVWRRKGLFPAPHRFGPNTIGWSFDEIHRWMESRPTV